MTIHTGLVSVTFRKLDPAAIIGLAQAAELQGIEWSAEPHVPAGDLATAAAVYRQTVAAGLTVAAYGSYYRIGCQPNGPEQFQAVLDSAVALHAPTIRVWAGDRPSATADEAWWDRVVTESRQIADCAAAAGITLAYEYHRNTLTDRNEAALRLLRQVNHPNVRSYWQPPIPDDTTARATGLAQIKPFLTHLHVFQWEGHSTTRLPLANGVADWLQYFKIAADATDRYALLEFVMDDAPEQFLQDARTLKTLVSQINQVD